MFPEPGTVCLSVREVDALRFARVLLEGGCDSCSVADAVPISGSIRQVGMRSTDHVSHDTYLFSAPNPAHTPDRAGHWTRHQ